MVAMNNNEELPVVRLLTAADIAHILAISTRQAYLLMETNQIANVRIGRSIRAFPADLEAYIDSLPRSRGKDV